MLTVQELLQKSKPKVIKRKLSLPDGTNEEVYIKGLNGKEASQEIDYLQSLTDAKGEFIAANTQKFQAYCIANRVCDENGNRELTQEQCEAMDSEYLVAIFKSVYDDVGAKNNPKK